MANPTVGLGAAGVLGLGFEALASPGTYVAPTKYVPIENENITYDLSVVKRRPIQGTVDAVASFAGNHSVAGDISMAAYSDVVPYFMYASRGAVTKTGAGTPWTYDMDGAHTALAPYSLSLTVERNGQVFGYTGCVVSSTSYSIEDGILMVTYSIVGMDESNEATPTEVYASSGNEFVAGQHVIEYADTAITTVDAISVNINDNAAPQFRDHSAGAAFIAYGERSVEVSLSRDFENLTEYNLFKSVTPQKWELISTSGAHSHLIHVPVSVADSYEVTLSGQGDLIRATINYIGDHDATLGAGYNITVISPEDITVPV